MLDALQLGLTVEDFWRMSPRAIVNLQRERIRQSTPAKRGRRRRGEPVSAPAKPKRMNYLPRP